MLQGTKEDVNHDWPGLRPMVTVTRGFIVRHAIGLLWVLVHMLYTKNKIFS